jgi:superfamily II DNA or RNA helicase
MSQLELLQPTPVPIPTTIAAPFLPKTAGRKQELFPFQVKMVRQTYDLIRANQTRILWVAAPSAGKTRISGQVMIDATQRAAKPLRTAFVVEMDVLAQQTVDTYKSLGLDVAIFKAGKKFRRNAQVVVISSQTLEQRAKKEESIQDLLGNFGLILGDEIHTLSQRGGWKLLNEAYRNSSTVFIGMTGTPWNGNGDRSLSYWFDVMVSAPQPPELVKMGRLVLVRGFSPDNMFDASELKWSASEGDYDIAAQQDAAIEDQKLRLVLEKYRERGEGRTAIAYCSGILHAKLLTKLFNENGIPSEFQIGSTPATERKAQHGRMEQGETKVLFSVGTCTKGYDAPFVSCIILARAIGNKNLYHQMACRGNRAYTYADGIAKQDCLLIDLGGNCERFGHLPTDYQDYAEALMPPKAKRETETEYKACPECGQEKISMFSKLCPNCGYEFGRKDDKDEPTLFDISAFQLKEYFTPLGTQQVQFLRTQKNRCFHENLNPDIAAAEFNAHFGFQPPPDWHLWAVFGKNATKANRARYHEYLSTFAPHDYWLNLYMRLEFGGECKVPNFLATWKTNWWEVLGVDKQCHDASMIKRCYLSLAKQWHPDICADKDNAKIQMQILNDAYMKAKSVILCE